MFTLYTELQPPRSARTTNQMRSGFNFTNNVAYDYDKIGQLTAAQGREADGGARLHEKFGYGYDAGNNPQFRTNNALIQKLHR